MSSSRFFLKTEITNSALLEISGEEGRQLVNVLRCKKGDIFKVFNGSGCEYTVKAETFKKDIVTVKVINVSYPETEPSISLILCQAIPKGQKMDYIVQKATEIGVTEILPLITERSLKEMSLKKLQRLNKITKEAIEQSGRLKPVSVNPPLTFEQVLKIMKNDDRGIVFSSYEENTPLKLLLKTKEFKGRIFVFIGPEGGFTEEELRLTKKYNLQIASLGPRIFRTETAGLAALSNIIYELEI